MDLYLIRDDVTWIIVLGVATFALLQNASKHTLLSMLVFGMFVAVGYRYLSQKATGIQGSQDDDRAFFDREGADKKVKEASSTQYSVATYPKKGFKYLMHNGTLVEILKDIVFVRMFDKARYQDIILHMNQMQKVYMYILDGRYSCSSFVATFLDLREHIQELLYSLIFVVPKHFQHIYGVHPHKVIDENIDRFTSHTSLMLSVLKSYCRKEKGERHFPIQHPKASDQPFDVMKARTLP